MEKIQTKPKKIKLTKKQKGFVNDFVIDENGTKAALNNYDIEGKDKVNIANQIAIENLQKPTIIAAIETKRMSLREALIEQGITEKRIAEKIDVLLNAEKPVFEKNDEGVYENVGTEIDYTAVDKGLKHATAIYGITPEGPSSTSNITYNFLFSSETQGRIKEINEVIKAKLISNEPNK